MLRSVLTLVPSLVATAALAGPVRIENREGRFALLRDGTPFLAKGAVAPNRFELLRECGANAVRTNAVRADLDAAHTGWNSGLGFRVQSSEFKVQSFPALNPEP